jgi:hypothetical protein
MVLFMLAAGDAVGLLFGWSMTGYSWSPLVLAVLGFVLVTLDALELETSPSRRDGSPQQAWSGPGAPVASDRQPLLSTTEDAARGSARAA